MKISRRGFIGSAVAALGVLATSRKCESKPIAPPILAIIKADAQGGTTLQLDGLGECLNVWEMITIEGCDHYNPLTLETTGLPMIFCVKDPVPDPTVNEINVFPSLIGSGMYRNINRLPKAGDIVRRHLPRRLDGVLTCSFVDPVRLHK